MSRPLSSLVIILVEGDVDSPARRIGKLRQMSGAQIGADGAGGIAKAGLPQDGEIEKTFDQDHRGEVPNRVPGEQAAFGAWQEPMRERGPDTATVQVDDLAVGFAAGKDHPSTEGVAALRGDQAHLQQVIERIAQARKMAA